MKRIFTSICMTVCFLALLCILLVSCGVTEEAAPKVTQGTVAPLAPLPEDNGETTPPPSDAEPDTQRVMPTPEEATVNEPVATSAPAPEPEAPEEESYPLTSICEVEQRPTLPLGDVYFGERQPLEECKSVHEVAEATYTGYYNFHNGNLYLRFKARHWYRGISEDTSCPMEDPDIFYAVLCPGDDPFTNDPSMIPFRPEETYLLLLSCGRTPYDGPQDVFSLTFNTLLVKQSDPSAATIDGQPLAAYLNGIDSLAGMTLPQLGEYFATAYAGNKYYNGYQYCRSDKAEDILQYANTVAVVSLDVIGASEANTMYTATVKTVLKGNVTEGRYISLICRTGDVTLGDEILIALLDPSVSGSGCYVYAAPNAIFPMEMLGDIHDMLPVSENAEA